MKDILRRSDRNDSRGEEGGGGGGVKQRVVFGAARVAMMVNH